MKSSGKVSEATRWGWVNNEWTEQMKRSDRGGAADGLGREGWLGQGAPGRVQTPTLARGLGAPGMEGLTLALRTALGSGFPPIKQRRRLQPRAVKERGALRPGRSGGRVLPLPPVTEDGGPPRRSGRLKGGTIAGAEGRTCLSSSFWVKKFTLSGSGHLSPAIQAAGQAAKF